MQRRKLLATLLVGVLLATAGCNGPDVQEKEETDPPGERLGDNAGDHGGTYKFHDNETGATCYVVQNSGGDPAIDCIKTNESG